MHGEAGKFAAKKLYEISYALCRVAGRIHPGVGARLEESAFQIVELSHSLNVENIFRALGIIKSQIQLGSDSGIINKANSDAIIGEISKLELFLRTDRDIEIGNKAEIENIFSSEEFKERKRQKSNEPEDFKSESGNYQSAEIRQKTIADFVEKSGNCRMKDLLEQFADVSERTLRNDLQNLAARGLIERMGEGGPGTYYRYKVAVIAPASGHIGTISGSGESGSQGTSNL
jgi:hypothetical protein